jgi:hypothetical protein
MSSSTASSTASSEITSETVLEIPAAPTPVPTSTPAPVPASTPAPVPASTPAPAPDLIIADQIKLLRANLRLIPGDLFIRCTDSNVHAIRAIMKRRCPQLVAASEAVPYSAYYILRILDYFQYGLVPPLSIHDAFVICQIAARYGFETPWQKQLIAYATSRDAIIVYQVCADHLPEVAEIALAHIRATPLTPQWKCPTCNSLSTQRGATCAACGKQKYTRAVHPFNLAGVTEATTQRIFNELYNWK